MRFIFAHYPDVPPASLTSKDIINYINHIVKVYGLLQNHGKIKRLNAIRQQLEIGPLPVKVLVPVSQRMLEKYGKDITLCPKCNKGKLVWICTTYPKTDKLIFKRNRNHAEDKEVFLNNKASPDEKTKP